MYQVTTSWVLYSCPYEDDTGLQSARSMERIIISTQSLNLLKLLAG